MVPVHDPVSKPTTQCICHHIQCTLQHTATLCSLHPNIQCTSSAHTTAAITSSVHTLQQPLHLQCTHYSSHYIFSAHTTAAITSSLHTAATTAIPFSAHCSYTIYCQYHTVHLVKKGKPIPLLAYLQSSP